jgi:hypothetical protein
LTNNLKNLTSTSHADLFTHGEFLLHKIRTQSNLSDTRRNQSEGTLHDTTTTTRSESFNVVLEDEEGGLTRVERAVSQRNSRYYHYESFSRDSEAELGLWPGTQTNVTGGLLTLHHLREDNRTMKRKGLAIRVGRDWEVRETYA